MLIDPRNGPDHDLCASASGVFVIASVPRSGSTLLARTLWEMGIGAPKEYLNPMQLRDWEVRMGRWPSRLLHRPLRARRLALVGATWSPRRLEAHLERVRAHRSNRWFGLKIHGHHHARWRLDLEALLGEIRWIRVRREDRLGQAISWARALASGQWVAGQPVRQRSVVYSRGAIERRLAAIAWAEAYWDAFFRERAACVVTYEQLVSDRAATIRRVTRWLGEGGESVPAPSLVRQADAETAIWRHRFLAGE